MPRSVRCLVVAGLWLGLASGASACPWGWVTPYPPADCCPPCPTPPPQFRAASPLPVPPGSCPAPGSHKPPVPFARPSIAPPSATVEPPLADPLGPPPAAAPRGPGPATLEPPLAVGVEPTSARTNAAHYPSTAQADGPFFDAYIRKAGPGRRAGERCVISFQNLTGREAVLVLEGQRQVLPAGETWRAEPKRQFVWQMEGRPAQSESVSANLAGLEIVLRR